MRTISARQPVYSLLCICMVGLVTGLIVGCGDETPLEPDPVVEIGIDTIPPANITDLRLRSATQSTFALVWEAPGDNGAEGQAAGYDIRHSTSTITESNWAAAEVVAGVPLPKPAGDIETFVVKGLASGADHYFAIKTYDEIPNESGLSNCASGQTISELTPPAAVQDLFAFAISETEFLLTWTAPGDDGEIGTATRYDIRYSIKPITASNFTTAGRISATPAPAPGGEPDSVIATGLSAGFNYYFALKTADDENNWSGISNKCLGLGFTEYLMVDPTIIYPSQVGEDILFMFRSNSSAERIEIAILKNVWNSDPVVIRHLVDGNFTPGVHTAIWDWKTDQGEYFFIWPYSSLMVKMYVDGVEKDDVGLRKAH